jgi:hypothetical protein
LSVIIIVEEKSFIVKFRSKLIEHQLNILQVRLEIEMGMWIMGWIWGGEIGIEWR